MGVSDEGDVVATDERPVQGAPDALIGLRPGDDEPADLAVGEEILEVGALERVAVVLVHERLALGPLELFDVLPAVGALGQPVVGVLHPDDGRLGGAGLLEHGVDVGDDAVTVVGVGHDVLLDVDDQQGGVGAIRQRGHADSLPLPAYSRGMAITEATPQRAAFHAMTEGTAEDWSIIADHTMQLANGLPDRVLDHFRLLGGDSGGFAVDRLEHSLQTATRAYRADEDDEYVVCALLHDMGDTLGSYNHADIAAAILKPFVSEENHWMVEQHGVFQGYYFWHYLGGDRDARDRFAGHPWYDRTATFCAEYDQVAFDPSYDTLPLEHFEPAVRELFARPR